MGGFSVPLCVLLHVCTMLGEKKKIKIFHYGQVGLTIQGLSSLSPWLWQTRRERWCLVFKMATYTHGHTFFLF
jgi:hypothetical protein